MGEPLTEIIAMFERVFAEQPPISGGPFQEVRIQTQEGEFVWAKQRR